MSKRSEREKDQILERAFKEIEEKFGKNAIFVGNESGDRASINVMPSGILSMDIASNIGGLPRGRLIEYYGYESSGKTTAALLNIAEAQKRGETCAFIDVEGTLEPTWAIKLGVDWEKLIISQPDTAEKALGIVETLVRSGKVSIIVIDSVAALVPKKELEGDIADVGFPIKARILSAAFRKLTSYLSSTKYSTVICLNHKMQKLAQGYGDKTTTPGGKALKFYASMRVKFSKIGWLKDSNDDKIGYKVQVKIIKSKCGTPYGMAEYDFLSSSGVDLVGEIINLAIEYKIMQCSKKEYFYNEKSLATGPRRLKKYFIENPNIFEEIKTKVNEKIKEGPKNPSEPVEELSENEKEENEQ